MLVVLNGDGDVWWRWWGIVVIKDGVVKGDSGE